MRITALLPIACVALWGAAPLAATLTPGGTCTISREVTLHIRSAAGSLDSVLEPGTTVRVLFVGDKGVKIETENEAGVVRLSELELACTKLAKGTYPECTLTGPLKMREKRRGKSRAFRIREGATVQIIKRGRKLARLKVGSVSGYTTIERLDEVCEAQLPDGPALVATPAKKKEPERQIRVGTLPELGEGQRVLVVPFATDGNVGDTRLIDLEKALRQTLNRFRSDVAGPDIAREAVDEREAPLKPWLKACFLAAKDSNVQFIVTGRAESTSDGLEVTVALLDVAARKVLHAVRTRPRSEDGDAWAERAVAVFDPALPPSRPADGLRGPAQAP